MKVRIVLMQTIAFVLLAFLISFSQSSKTYYVCDCQANADPDCIPGDGNNNGTSLDTPWQIYQKTQSEFGYMQAGDQVLFARRGSVNPTTVIQYLITNRAGMSERQKATLKIYNMIGQQITTLVNEQQLQGDYSVKFDASELGCDIYCYQLKPMMIL